MIWWLKHPNIYGFFLPKFDDRLVNFHFTKSLGTRLKLVFFLVSPISFDWKLQNCNEQIFNCLSKFNRSSVLLLLIKNTALKPLWSSYDTDTAEWVSKHGFFNWCKYPMKCMPWCLFLRLRPFRARIWQVYCFILGTPCWVVKLKLVPDLWFSFFGGLWNFLLDCLHDPLSS